MRGGLPWRSAPVQKARPAPVIIPTQSVSSWSNRSQISAISRLVALSMQLSFGCRSMVTWTTHSSGKDTRKCLYWRGPERKDMASRSAKCEAMPGLVLCDGRCAPPPVVLCLFISDIGEVTGIWVAVVGAFLPRSCTHISGVVLSRLWDMQDHLGIHQAQKSANNLESGRR